MQKIIESDDIVSFVKDIEITDDNEEEIISLILEHDAFEIFKYMFKHGYENTIAYYIEEMNIAPINICYHYYWYKVMLRNR